MILRKALQQSVLANARFKFNNLMSGIRFQLAFLAGLATGVLQVRGMKVYVSGELEAVNGTDIRLKCTFRSSKPISASLSVSWTFKPLDSGLEESVFYYQRKAYPPTQGHFQGQVVWEGDVQRQDASIRLLDVKVTFNGTFSCQVRNPPDVHGVAGEVLLKVVYSASFSKIAILALAIGGAIAVVIIIFIIFSLKFCNKKDQEGNPEMDLEIPIRERGNTTVL